jgi:predicted RNA-binding protein Jag
MNARAIETTLKAMLEHLGARDVSVTVEELEGGDITKFSVKTPDAPTLIGIEGRNLMALNYLVKKIVERDEPETDREAESGKKTFIIDVNDYQQKKIQDLKSKARIMAERARYFKSDIEMMPMSPYERMIIHSFFSSTPDIQTESVGRGKDRRVVLKYTSTE